MTIKLQRWLFCKGPQRENPIFLKTAVAFKHALSLNDGQPIAMPSSQNTVTGVVYRVLTKYQVFIENGSKYVCYKSTKIVLVLRKAQCRRISVELECFHLRLCMRNTEVSYLKMTLSGYTTINRLSCTSYV